MLKKTKESLRNSSAMQMTKKAVSQLSPCHLLHGIDSEFVFSMYLKSLLGLPNRSLWNLVVKNTAHYNLRSRP
jgi:hypothetical protein